MSTTTQTRTAQLLSAKQLREQQESSGREGLSNLLAAVRRMMDWLLMPFRMMARVLFSPKQAGTENPAAENGNPVVRAAGFTPASNDDVSLSSLVPAGATDQTEPEITGLMKQIVDNPNGGLDIEVTGAPDELDAVLPMLLRHVEQILKTYLPSDAKESEVVSHLVALAETAECSRHAHRLVSREVDGAMKSVLADPKYFGLSAATVQGMLRSVAKSPELVASFGEGSAEQRLLSRLTVRDKIEADFMLQTQQMAVVLSPIAGRVKSNADLHGRAKELMDGAMKAAAATRSKFQVRQLTQGAPRMLPDTLPPLLEAFDRALGNLVAIRMEESGVKEPAQKADVVDVPVVPTTLQAEPLPSLAHGKMPPVSLEKIDPKIGNAPSVPTSQVAVATAPRSADAVKVAAAAVQSVRSGGMFGSSQVIQRTAAELAEEDVVDEVFGMDEGENLVSG